jgi:hypothetical protein
MIVALPWTLAAAQPGASPAPMLRAALSHATPKRAGELADVARRAIALLSDWLGPYPFPTLTIVDASWHATAAPPTDAATAAVAVRWIELERDPAAERALIGAIARHYWSAASARAGDHRWFVDGIARYTSLRAIDTILEGRQHWSARYAGGFIPYAARSLPLSPHGGDARGHVPPFDDGWAHGAGDDPAVARAVAALYTLERFIGWPAVQQALAAFREQEPSKGASPAALAAVLSEQRGHDLSWFFADAVNVAKTFDYGVDGLTSTREGDRYRVGVGLRRIGDATFGSAAVAGASLAVVLTLADGTRVTERWPGASATAAFDYDTVSPAVQVTVDPDAMLVLDADRRNNSARLTAAPNTTVSMRATAAWLTWLEDLTLTWLALV